jgi:putative inorganic carbon (hco3(-)) transporter
VEFLKNRNLYETIFVVLVTLLFAIGISLLGTIALKFQLALIIGMVGMILIVLNPKRRTLCLALWVLIQPLSIEKILYTGTPLWEKFRGQEIVMNMADVILFLLAFILVIEGFSKRKPILVWDKKATLFLMLLVWGVFSYLLHLNYFQDDFVSQAPIGLLHLFRNLIFVVVVSSAIQTRADLIWIAVAVLAILLFESILVGLSYATGELYNFSRLIGQYSGGAQSYTGAAGTMIRASGTLGVANQQALFHAMFSFLLLGLFALKNTLFRHAALFVLLASFVAVIFTFSRSAWLSMGLSSMLVAGLFIQKKLVTPRAWLLSGLLAIGFVGFLAIFAQPIIDRLTKGDNGATDSRVRMIMLAKDLFLNNPIIGVGPAEYPEAGLKLYPPGYKDTEWVPLGGQAIVPPLGRVELARAMIDANTEIIIPLSVHNKYLLTLSELGIVGLMLWLMIIYRFFIDAKNCANSNNQFLKYIGIAGIGIILVASVYMMLDLFADDKTLQIMLFPLLVVSAAAKINNNLFNQEKERNLAKPPT